MKEISFWSRRLYRRTIQLFGSRFYINPNPDLSRSILVAGTARSGTTWLGDLISSHLPSRILFEPFNPDLVPGYRHFHYFQYMRPGMENPEFYGFAQKVFKGEIRSRWIDHQNEKIVSKYRLVKEIRANLALRWLHDNFNAVPIIFILRHPCAVVMSRMDLRWDTDRDIASFLSQPHLLEDHLEPYMDLIYSAKKAEEKHAVIWCVSNMVPLKQIHSNEMKVVFYEDLCTQPEIELSEILEAVGYKNSSLSLSNVDRPSQTTRRTSPVVAGREKIGNWKQNLDQSQINNILRIVQRFDLSYLYGHSSIPLHGNLR